MGRATDVLWPSISSIWSRSPEGQERLALSDHPEKGAPALLKLALRYARSAVVPLTSVGFALIPAEEAGGEPLQVDASTCYLSLQLPGDVIAWVLAWVAASLAHGLGGQDRAYLYQTQRAPRCERLQTVGVNDPKSEPLLRLQGEHFWGH